LQWVPAVARTERLGFSAATRVSEYTKSRT